MKYYKILFKYTGVIIIPTLSYRAEILSIPKLFMSMTLLVSKKVGEASRIQFSDHPFCESWSQRPNLNDIVRIMAVHEFHEAIKSFLWIWSMFFCKAFDMEYLYKCLIDTDSSKSSLNVVVPVNEEISNQPLSMLQKLRSGIYRKSTLTLIRSIPAAILNRVLLNFGIHPTENIRLLTIVQFNLVIWTRSVWKEGWTLRFLLQ